MIGMYDDLKIASALFSEYNLGEYQGFLVGEVPSSGVGGTCTFFNFLKNPMNL